MKQFFTFFVSVLLFSTVTFGQTAVKQAYLDEEGIVQVKEIITNETENYSKETFSQQAGFPVKFASNSTYKPFRGVAIADIDGLPGDEIIVSTNDSVYVVKGDGSVLWQAKLNGLAQYPPTVGDINNDGKPEIIVGNSYATQRGAIDIFDYEGNPLEGFPYVITRGPIMCAPTISDIDGDGYLDIIFGTRGHAASELDHLVRVLNYKGEDVAGFPAILGNTPAVTPSIADINNDEKPEIIISTTEGWYVFDNEGNILDNYPVLFPEQEYRFSYQSPVVVDFDGEGNYNIVGGTHGNTPIFYAIDALSGEFRDGWPFYVPDESWTYCPPTVVYLEDEEDYAFFIGRPLGDEVPAPMLWKFDKDGNVADNFPIVKTGGLEGFISVADINNDGKYEIIFGSNQVDAETYDGFIYAYNMDGTPVDGYPIRPHGFTFMNGANFGDIMGDGNLYLVALSYEQTFSPDDKTILNVYPLNVPMNDKTVLFGSYKGSNSRAGFVNPVGPIGIKNEQSHNARIYPNPAKEYFYIDCENMKTVNVYNSVGQLVEKRSVNDNTHQIYTQNYTPGLYVIEIIKTDNYSEKVKVVIQ
ncbi:T9SS type A sorting domain-containing protein [Bacteroidales bacterium OttesenSCG-928-K22]|nr:T9SS type A sorting domain-containing protein [Bacteroidales bacterium OttesenSCG-928-K22]